MAPRIVQIEGEELEEILRYLNEFAIPGEHIKLERLYQGHLHQTYIGTWKNNGESSRYIHQMVNPIAFPNTKLMLKNVVAIVDFLSEHGVGAFPEFLRLISTKSEEPYLESNGKLWRTYHFIEGSESHDLCISEEHAYSFGRASAEFISVLSSLPHDLLSVHIEGFQNTDSRMQELLSAEKDGDSERKEKASSLYDLVTGQLENFVTISRALGTGDIPTRTIHYDTKVNNFLFRAGTTEVLSLIDIDLCMPGSALYDFGDLVRSASVLSVEDEADLKRVKIEPKYISEITKGFLSVESLELTPREKELLPMAPATISYNLTMRFLGDYLLGDPYFPVSRPDHNLQRAEAQWEVTKQLESHSSLIASFLE